MPPIEDLLKLKNNVSIPAPTQAQPNYNSSQFSGGGYQVGDAAKQIGPTDDEAMYGALSEVAGGVKKSIDIFTDIRSQMEKAEIEKAKLKYKSILGGDYDEKVGPDGAKVKTYMNPAAKLAEWDEYTRDIWTPLLGNNWLEDTNLDAYAAFGNREAQDKFEQGRYSREFLEYSRNNPDRNPNSLDFKQEFDMSYATKFRSAQTNEWFKNVQLFNKGAIFNRNEQEAKDNLGLLMASSYPFPNEDQMNIINSNSEEGIKLKATFPEFFKLVEDSNSLASDADIELMLYNKFYSDIYSKERKYPPNVQLELARILPEQVKAYRKVLKDAIIPMRIALRKEKAMTAFAQTSEELMTGRDTPEGVKKLLKTAATHGADLAVPKHKVSEVLQSFGVDIIGAFHNSSNVGGEASIEKRISNWRSLDPYQQESAVRALGISYLNEPGSFGHYGPTLGKQLSDAFQIPEKDLASMLFSTAVFKGSKEHQEAITVYEKNKSNNFDQNLKSLELLSTEDAIVFHTNNSIASLSTRLELSVSSLRKYYIETDSNGIETFTVERDVEKWFNELPFTEQSVLMDRGFNSDKKQSIIDILNQAESFEKAAIAQTIQISKGNTSVIDAQQKANDTLQDQLALLSPNSQPSSSQSFGSIKLATVSGNLFTEGSVKVSTARDTLLMTYDYVNTYNSIPLEFRDPSGMVKKNTKGLSPAQIDSIAFMEGGEFSNLVNIPGFNDNLTSIYQLSAELENKASVLASLSPRYSKKGADQKQFKRVFDAAKDNILKGRAVEFNGQLPANSFDEKTQDFTEAGYTYLLQASMIGSLALESSDPQVQKKYGDIMARHLSALGNTDVDKLFADKDIMTTLLSVNLMSKSFAQEYERSQLLTTANSDFAFSYHMKLAFSAEDTDLPRIVELFTSKEGMRNFTIAQAIPFMLAHNIRNDVQTSPIAQMDKGGVAIPMTIPQIQGRLATMALLKQLSPEFEEQVKKAYTDGTPIPITNQGVTPLDDAWSAVNFRQTLVDNGFLDDTVDMAQLASVMKASFLDGTIMNDQYYSDEALIKLAAQVLFKATGEDTRRVSSAFEFYSGPIGIKHPAFDPANINANRKMQTKAEFLFGLMGITTDIDLNTRSSSRVEGAITTGSTSINRNHLATGKTTISTQDTIVNSDKTQSSTPYDMFTLSEVATNSGFNLVDAAMSKAEQERLRVWNETQREFQRGVNYKKDGSLLPGLVRENVGGGRGGSIIVHPAFIPSEQNAEKTLSTRFPPLVINGEPQDGIPYRSTVAVLQAKPTKEILEALLHNWLEDNSPAYYSSSTIALNSLAYNPPERIQRRGLGADAIFKVMENPPETVDAALRLIADTYDGYKNKSGSKGSNFIDRQKYNQSVGRANPVQEYKGNDNANYIPTFVWAERTMAGKPFISLNDEVLRLVNNHYLGVK